MYLSDNVIKRTADFVKNQLENEGSGHDWWHISRVWAMSVKIAETEKCNIFIVQLAALLHDIADWKFYDDYENRTRQIVTGLLSSLQVEPQIIENVIEIIGQVSYKGAGVKTIPDSIEGRIVQDADRLDAMGAIGIARTFAYGGNKNRAIYVPYEKPVLHQSFDEYKTDKGHTINHFYEKLLLLKDRMNTQTAGRIAAARHSFMEIFLQQFYAEWDGKL